MAKETNKKRSELKVVKEKKGSLARVWNQILKQVSIVILPTEPKVECRFLGQKKKKVLYFLSCSGSTDYLKKKKRKEKNTGKPQVLLKHW